MLYDHRQRLRVSDYKWARACLALKKKLEKDPAVGIYRSHSLPPSTGGFSALDSASLASRAPGSVTSTPSLMASATSAAGPVNHLRAHRTQLPTAKTAMMPTATTV